MKKVSKLFALGLFVVFSLILTTCGDWNPVPVPSFDYYLRGTWVSNQNEYAYGGTLEITMYNIKITGYGPKDKVSAAQQPFRSFTQNVSLEGYSEGELSRTDGEGYFYIYDKGSLQPGIPFKYYSAGSERLLLFNFGGREEILKKISD